MAAAQGGSLTVPSGHSRGRLSNTAKNNPQLRDNLKIPSMQSKVQVGRVGSLARFSSAPTWISKPKDSSAFFSSITTFLQDTGLRDKAELQAHSNPPVPTLGSSQNAASGSPRTGPLPEMGFPPSSAPRDETPTQLILWVPGRIPTGLGVSEPTRSCDPITAEGSPIKPPFISSPPGVSRVEQHPRAKLQPSGTESPAPLPCPLSLPVLLWGLARGCPLEPCVLQQRKSHQPGTREGTSPHLLQGQPKRAVPPGQHQTLGEHRAKPAPNQHRVPPGWPGITRL